jgi:hypothetical protein
MGDDTILEAIGKGNIKATMQVGGELCEVTFCPSTLGSMR